MKNISEINSLYSKFPKHDLIIPQLLYGLHKQTLICKTNTQRKVHCRTG